MQSLQNKWGQLPFSRKGAKSPNMSEFKFHPLINGKTLLILYVVVLESEIIFLFYINSIQYRIGRCIIQYGARHQSLDTQSRVF